MKVFRLVGLLAGLVAAQDAFALINGELLLGRRWHDLKADSDDSVEPVGVQASETALRVMLDPIPLVPVALGLTYTLNSYRDEDHSFDSMSSNQVGVAVKAWSPVELLSLTPYGMIDYTVAGSLTADRDGVDYEFDFSGYHLNIGVEYNIPIPLIAILFEVGTGQGEWKLEKAGDADVSDSSSMDRTSQSFLLGVEVGF